MRRFCRVMLFALVAAGLAGISSVDAACPPPKITSPESVKLNSEGVLVVTHATAYYDLRYSIKHGLDSAVRWAKANRIPVVYLVDESPIQFYEMEDCQPDYWVRSIDGEVPFDITASTVYLAGGHLELCLARTANEILFSQLRSPSSNRRYVFLMDAIYSNGKSIDEQDPYHAEFKKFFDVVNYGRPGGEAAPRVNLLEILGSIKPIKYQYDYLKNVIPRWDRSAPDDYEVLLQIKDLYAQTLRKGKSWTAPKIKFEFVESADSLN